MWPAWSQAESSFEPSNSSTRMPQTNNAALMLRPSRAFRMRALASGHRRLESSFKLGSSMVRASCGGGAAAARDGTDLPFGESAPNLPTLPVKSGAHEAAETVFKADERNLRRFIFVTSVKRI